MGGGRSTGYDWDAGPWLAEPRHRLEAWINDVAMHVCSAFNLRVREMDWPLCRLALFLDPRYRGLIDPKASVKPLFKQAIEISKRHGHGQQSNDRLVSQLVVYNARQEPFDLPPNGSSFDDLRLWWLSMLPLPSADMIAQVALTILDIVPHAASMERTFSIMGWFQDKRSNRFKDETVKKMTTIKTWYDSQASDKSANNAKASALEVPTISNLDIKEPVTPGQPAANPQTVNVGPGSSATQPGQGLEPQAAANRRVTRTAVKAAGQPAPPATGGSEINADFWDGEDESATAEDVIAHLGAIGQAVQADMAAEVQLLRNQGSMFSALMMEAIYGIDESLDPLAPTQLPAPPSRGLHVCMPVLDV
ncbi:hypothetical protein VOLCADRAFT_97304 [Volvox carteri f. nagariensis]|uniref:HAT C-terminal dimerisation domain-containing protein n=1 Tax=Volvox carteri f. nagariensis TaxID=3068 RepID=D8UCE8_VOLCA|nr:uncharacterized protein VOLCADRAFT_97304 [Volvox carteri f. nagariensis]EFJ42635.1 hypothetical protein VOLCADRAFT_97304 [Volvox carteri f. nagariensis]|eukprot:XP_002956286.1 hypothetical protein VOLCADRAFT_97304 [Volvox carteri f. nagariensis]